LRVSIPDRIFRISKAYLNQVRDRIDAELTEREQAQQELENATGIGTAPPASSSTSRGGSASVRDDVTNAEEMMRRAEERIAAARRELEVRNSLNRAGETATVSSTSPSTTTSTSAAATAAAVETPEAKDYRVLGVPLDSDLATVQNAFEKLSRRCDPRRFPEGSAEQKDAERILVRVNAAYESLRKRLDPTENRFGKLELE
jgi:hypothetical protein